MNEHTILQIDKEGGLPELMKAVADMIKEGWKITLEVRDYYKSGKKKGESKPLFKIKLWAYKE